jgi:4-aminobutyrate aminotransferase-like enzyme
MQCFNKQVVLVGSVCCYAVLCCVLLCRYAADVADLIQGATPGAVAGFISETIQGVGGSVPLADGYLPEVYKVGHAQHSTAQHSTAQQLAQHYSASRL